MFYHSLYEKMFTIKRTLFYCTLTWIFSFMLNIPNLVGIYK